MDIKARYDGSTHNFRIFRECKRRALLGQEVYGDALLVEDSCYASSSYMMTHHYKNVFHQKNSYITSRKSGQEIPLNDSFAFGNDEFS